MPPLFPLTHEVRGNPNNICSAILCIALNPQSGDFSGAILGVRSVALLHLIKVLFCNLEFLSRSLVRPWFLLGLLPEGNREGTRDRNLKNCALLSLTSLPPWVGEAGGEVVGIVAGEASGGGGEIVVSSRLSAKDAIAHLNHIQIDL